MPERKYYDMSLMDLGALQRGDYKTRIVNFYSMFGPKGTSQRVTVFPAKEIAVLCDIQENQNPKPGQEPTPAGLRVAQIRSQATKEGLLEKIFDFGGYRYTWRATEKTRELTPEALEILNSRTPDSIRYCQRGDMAYLRGWDQWEDLPNIYLLRMKNSKPWWEALPSLVDFSLPETWEIWLHRIPNSLSGKGHPLSGVEDRDQRIQMAMLGLEKGLTRNLKRNKNWEPDDLTAWLQSTLKFMVGKEKSWTWQSNVKSLMAKTSARDLASVASRWLDKEGAARGYTEDEDTEDHDE